MNLDLDNLADAVKIETAATKLDCREGERLEPGELGSDVEPVGVSTFMRNARQLAADTARAAAAVEELRAAMDALPHGVRAKLGKVVLTMHDGTEEDGA